MAGPGPGLRGGAASARSFPLRPPRAPVNVGKPNPLGESSPLFSLFSARFCRYHGSIPATRGAHMADESYEAPQITVLGDITDMTQAKPGIYFDFPGSAEGNSNPPAPHAPGTS